MKIITAQRKPKTIKLLKVSEKELLELKKKYRFIAMVDKGVKNIDDEKSIGFLDGKEDILEKIIKKEEINTMENVWFVNRNSVEEDFILE